MFVICRRCVFCNWIFTIVRSIYVRCYFLNALPFNSALLALDCLSLTTFPPADLSGERVVLASAGQCSLAELGGRVPTEQARYHLFRFSHTHEGDSLQSNGEFNACHSRLQTETPDCLHFRSVHLLHAWVRGAHQGADDVLQLQERRGRRTRAGRRHLTLLY